VNRSLPPTQDLTSFRALTPLYADKVVTQHSFACHGREQQQLLNRPHLNWRNLQGRPAVARQPHRIELDGERGLRTPAELETLKESGHPLNKITSSDRPSRGLGDRSDGVLAPIANRRLAVTPIWEGQLLRETGSPSLSSATSTAQWSPADPPCEHPPPPVQTKRHRRKPTPQDHSVAAIPATARTGDLPSGKTGAIGPGARPMVKSLIPTWFKSHGPQRNPPLNACQTDRASAINTNCSSRKLRKPAHWVVRAQPSVRF